MSVIIHVIHVCDHEESYTRMFVHALHASQTCNHVIIKSPDTDVAILGVCLSEHFTVNLYFLTGVGNKTMILDLKKVASHLGQSICSSLIGVHIFTGCDSTSAFYGKGKKKHFDLACKHEAFLSAFKDLGTSLDLRESTMKALEKFVCHMYGQHKANDVNDARYKVFCLGTTTPLEKTIPTIALKEHCKHVNHQAAIWKRTLQRRMSMPSPAGHGWHMENGELKITWMTQPPAPESIRVVVNCGCKNGKCDNRRCSCVDAQLACTDCVRTVTM